MEFKNLEAKLQETIKGFKEINKIGFIGLIGSLNLEKDLDIIITPNKNIKKGEFLKTLCNFLESLKRNLKKRNSNLIILTHSTLQEEVEYISKRKKQDIFLHISSFPDFTKDLPILLKPSNKIYHGKKENLDQISITNIDFYYNHLLYINCLYSNYPKELETKKIHERISYIFKHNNSKINIKDKTNKQIYFECCDFLDSIAEAI